MRGFNGWIINLVESVVEIYRDPTEDSSARPASLTVVLTPGECEADAERHQHRARDGFDTPLDAIGEQHGGHAIDESRVERQPHQSHGDVCGGEEHGLGQMLRSGTTNCGRNVT